MDFCFAHPGVKAVATCGNCRRPVCPRCTLNVDRVAYCSTDCLSELNAPSADSLPARPSKTAAGGTILDEVSEIVRKTHAEREVKAPPPVASAEAHREPSITLKAAQADPQSSPSSRKMAVPGTGRGMLSSSCFFHPDTSAIVRCVKCRNP